ncbi:hypothetical protein SAMN02746065_10899 [Desulfocicer vacuolatum DSM 3385]|uniref:DUF7479 domain-containing protein n=1 Tax=Desulfocicer vacuolatum DSM 3385 TaxID=1121400 RepID=A0A1W2BIR4_9BACT|nr:CLJU_RS11820 family redox protein [Desulfocicer vacuolatum]SMC72338.1 hypothetical protein SAMN02746065_10899 [Desulfocicer vacuolatum DSM 3385]
MSEDGVKICHRCQIELEPTKTDFKYLGHSFFTDILRCPVCGEVYIPEQLVETRMSEVEKMLEDK